MPHSGHLRSRKPHVRRIHTFAESGANLDKFGANSTKYYSICLHAKFVPTSTTSGKWAEFDINVPISTTCSPGSARIDQICPRSAKPCPSSTTSLAPKLWPSSAVSAQGWSTSATSGPGSTRFGRSWPGIGRSRPERAKCQHRCDMGGFRARLNTEVRRMCPGPLESVPRPNSAPEKWGTSSESGPLAPRFERSFGGSDVGLPMDGPHSPRTATTSPPQTNETCLSRCCCTISEYPGLEQK